MQAPFTLNDWMRLPEGFPAQLIDGCLVREPAPTYGHQTVVGRIYRHLVELLGEAHVVLAPADVVLDRLNVLQPDVCVLRKTPALDSHDVGIPRIAFEVLSPSARRRDRTAKATKLLAAGVEEIWLVDPVRQTIEVRNLRESIVYRDEDEVRSQAVPGLAFVPRQLFARP